MVCERAPGPGGVKVCGCGSELEGDEEFICISQNLLVSTSQVPSFVPLADRVRRPNGLDKLHLPGLDEHGLGGLEVLLVIFLLDLNVPEPIYRPGPMIIPGQYLSSSPEEVVTVAKERKTTNQFSTQEMVPGSSKDW